MHDKLTNYNINRSQSSNYMEIPWAEKYRPTKFSNIVLNPYNELLFKSMIEQEYIPNMLFFGPPGTGKTTTIINLINMYQEKKQEMNKGLTIHLNASDDRGIDIIRNQIHSFVNSKTFFNNGLKIVILDEVDSMTKNAQQALIYLMNDTYENTRFFLICNYISKIDESLQSLFLKIKFNHLPKQDILTFLKHVSEKEKLMLTDLQLNYIQELFGSDIRSMINYMQTNQDNQHFKIIHSDIWKDLHESKEPMVKIDEISCEYNMDKKHIIKEYLYYTITHNIDTYDLNKLNEIELAIHISDINIDYVIHYIFNS
jgi:DNA polymerase III delta prime subunit